MIFKKSLAFAAVVAAVAVVSSGAHAYEFGYGGAAQKPGVTLGGTSAAVPPPGVYMFNQFFTYQSKIVGPGAPNVGGNQTSLNVANATVGLLWVPGWTFLGAQYNALIVAPANIIGINAPINITQSGFHNTYIVPIELSWKLGDSGFFVKTGLGIYVPNGDIQGANGLASTGAPWWTFQPEFIVSYLKDGWNLTATLSAEFNTRNTITNYVTGNSFHAEFTATKMIGNWTVGPVGYYVGQVSDDKSSAFYGGAINVNRFDIWAAGALVGYNFGPVAVNVWATSEVLARASGGNAGPPGVDTATITRGYSVMSQLSFRLWAPDAPVSANPRYRK